MPWLIDAYATILFP